jgi:hypothetical protein
MKLKIIQFYSYIILKDLSFIVEILKYEYITIIIKNVTQVLKINKNTKIINTMEEKRKYKNSINSK